MNLFIFKMSYFSFIVLPQSPKVLVLEIESKELNKLGHIYMQHVHAHVAEVSVTHKHDPHMYFAHLNFARFV